MIKRIVKLGGFAVDLLTSGGGVTPVLENTVAPSITGTLEAGYMVTADPGEWNATPTAYTYVWKRGGVPIPEGVGTTYMLTGLDVGANRISVDVTAIRLGWASGTASSAPVTVLGGTPDDGLWFEKTPAGASTKKMFGHFFGSFPISHSNPGPNGPPTNSDYWESAFLSINGESGKHAAYGGYVRDRPAVDKIPFAGTNTWGSAASWRRAMQNEELRICQKYGVDGLLTDLLWMSGDNWLRIVELFDACSANFPGLNVVPMLDADINSSITFSTILANMTTLLSKSCNLVINGQTVLASYRPESKGVQFWNDLRTGLAANGINITYWHCFLNTSTAADYPNKSICGTWDTGTDPGQVLSGSINQTWITNARARGEGILHPVWWQNIRMINSNPIHFAESLNTSGLRANWQRVRERNSEHVQLATWDDFGEQSQHKPSVMRGENALALDCWYAERWKHGAYPTILRDAVFVSHRAQMFGVQSPSLVTTITGGQTLHFQQTSGSSRSAVREHVEVLTFLTAEDTITITVGSTVHGPFITAAGEQVRTVPMGFGNVSVTTGRGITVNSPIPIRTTSGNEDRQYVVASNMNSNEQYNPTPAS